MERPDVVPRARQSWTFVQVCWAHGRPDTRAHCFIEEGGTNFRAPKILFAHVCWAPGLPCEGQALAAAAVPAGASAGGCNASIMASGQSCQPFCERGLVASAPLTCSNGELNAVTCENCTAGYH